VEDGAGTVADDVQLEVHLRAQRGQQVQRHAGAAAWRAAGRQRVLLHLVPGGLAGQRAGQDLQRVVQPIQQEVLGRAQHALGPAPAHRVLQDVGDGGPVVAVPDEADRIDVRVQHHAAIVGHPLDRAALVDQAAVGVQQHVLFRPARHRPRHVHFEDLAQLGNRGAVVSARAKRAVVAQADDVRPQVGVRIGHRAAGGSGVRDRRRLALPQHHWRAQPRHPDVGGVGQPVVVADPAEAGQAPLVAPGVLDPEAVAVVSDDGKRMDAEQRLRPGDVALGVDIVPALVHRGRRIQDADLGQRAVHRDQVLVVDAQVGAQRPAQRVRGAGLGQSARQRRGVLVLPLFLAAHAVLLPALHRAAGAGAAVGLARPFVVAARHLVQHARADRRLVGHHLAPLQQEVGHCRQAEAGAGAFLALVQHRNAPAQVIGQWNVRGHFDQRGLEHAVAKVQRVAPRGELARHLAAGAAGDEGVGGHGVFLPGRHGAAGAAQGQQRQAGAPSVRAEPVEALQQCLHGPKPHLSHP